MDQISAADNGTGRIQRWLFWVLVLGLAGTETELLLLEHYEDRWQFVPLILIALGMAALLWHRQRRNVASVQAMQTVMALFLASGLAGVALHFRGAAQFQLEIDPTISAWELTHKVLRAKAPPVLAPGVMLQLGLVGLIYVRSDSSSKRRIP